MVLGLGDGAGDGEETYISESKADSFLGKEDKREALCAEDSV